MPVPFTVDEVVAAYRSVGLKATDSEYVVKDGDHCDPISAMCLRAIAGRIGWLPPYVMEMTFGFLESLDRLDNPFEMFREILDAPDFTDLEIESFGRGFLDYWPDCEVIDDEAWVQGKVARLALLHEGLLEDQGVMGEDDSDVDFSDAELIVGDGSVPVMSMPDGEFIMDDRHLAAFDEACANLSNQEQDPFSEFNEMASRLGGYIREDAGKGGDE